MLGFALLAGTAWGHKPSDSYLALEVDGSTVRGQWDVALRDLEHAIGLDADGDGAITWGELRAKHAEIAAYAFARLALPGCAIKPLAHLVDHHSDGAYAVLQFSADCGAAAARELEVKYTLFADLDPTHLSDAARANDLGCLPELFPGTLLTADLENALGARHRGPHTGRTPWDCSMTCGGRPPVAARVARVASTCRR